MAEKCKLENNKVIWKMASILIILSLILAMAIGLSGCTKEKEEKQSPPEVFKQVKLFFVNKDFVETGDESNGALIEYDAISIGIPEKTPEGMTDEEVASNAYVDTITSLWEVPDELKNANTIVTDKFGIHNITCKDGTAYVDLIGEDLKGSGGSFEETVLISQIVETLVKSFEEIERVKFLVDGQEVETLMGHCDTTEAFTESFYK